MNYLIADLLLRIKNAYLARRKEVVAPYSNVNKEIGKVLVKLGFLSSVKEVVDGKKRSLAITLRYVRRKPVVNDVLIISKPSLRVYVDKAHLAKEMRRDAMTTIISTSSGVMSGEDAKKKGVGGELLFKIW
jgi:small subunit ribosomal protein S8